MSYQVTHELANSARLVISEVAIVFCRYKYAPLDNHGNSSSAHVDICAVSGLWQLEQGLSVTRRDMEPVESGSDIPIADSTNIQYFDDQQNDLPEHVMDDSHTTV
ncbi:hypothetical protein EI94DRAFT_1806042 [Lactarius quietus]|nr:hypothetical protein EI94DRAFT_1806042 [Lactarius quietus]